ncbi:hypothetical protein LEP1GSC021_1017 [Leptospira noguchii str. 1993005606]|nr:hypothetical protein LEP1GSC021_1017 [Leptospira noguchii str. 1993005606]
MVLQDDLNEAFWIIKILAEILFCIRFDCSMKSLRITQEIIFSLSKDLEFIGWSYES